ncbi:hypothetical protein FEK35_24680 [Nocardia cyriacigeorgica]|uniref:Uncharacterized protein n=1 Tax=Nocardia cyriacigeorgica TaxID=135487 RepID=A0A5R8P8G6_9NOCA|nr:hypothetical protein [Nocardia cyriacigeorgica]TLG00266.1 hypothetical protein FEK35_24680 [Nocardia cyriacigeorgica]
MEYMQRELAEEIRTRLLQPGPDFNSKWANTTSRYVLPAGEITDLVADPEGARLLTAFEIFGESTVNCLTVDDLGSNEARQAVIASVNEINDWRWSVAPFDVVMTSDDLEAAVLLSVDEFILVGGTREFVETALGKPVDRAKADFATYAAEMAHASRHLPALAEKYCG